ncbi:MAG TPA: hypothetical protein VHU19_10975 [Pyrinomonadaceae bacterium]|jgi:hypothetical protein|nr:hypothetical protein [Pyrinomonadaceae bacterium]
MRKKQSKLLLLIFVASYGFAWQLSSIHAVFGLMFLSFMGLIISIPIIIQNRLGGLVITIVLIILSTFFPPCAVCLPLWGLMCILASIGMLLGNWLPALMGFILYALLLVGPFALVTASQSEFEGDHRLLMSGVSFVLGAAIMLGSCSFMEKLGYTRRNIAYFTLGLPACLCMLVVAILGFGDDGGDGGGDGGDVDGGN